MSESNREPPGEAEPPALKRLETGQAARQEVMVLSKVSQQTNREEERPGVLDLFAGCGGLSLGFHAAGFEILGAVEIDPPAVWSHAVNFHKHLPDDAFEKHAKPRNIASTEPLEMLTELGVTSGHDVSVIVGGPPCQAFARVGRAKLREVAEHPEAFLQDPRSNLYLRYLDYVKELQPAGLLMENVPDVLNYGGHNIAEEVCEALEELGYQCRYTMLNAVFYGVPQMRERMFLVAYRHDIKATRWFPEPTHWCDLPIGYHGTRMVAMKTIVRNFFRQNRFFVDPMEPERQRCLPAVTARNALGDLPPITLHLEGRLKKGPRHFDEPIPYPPVNNLNDYQALMRSWQGFEAPPALLDHVIRYLPRDYAIFRRMNPGDQYPEAYRHAIGLFRERLESFERENGWRPRHDSKEYKELVTAIVPPYDPGKFPNKWRKMEADRPVRTLMAHLGKDSYSHIHYDSNQARTISVREAARLQSFPDGFVFQGPMNPAFRQIGNAVPPLMAKALAETILDQIGDSLTYEEENSPEKAVVF